MGPLLRCASLLALAACAASTGVGAGSATPRHQRCAAARPHLHAPTDRGALHTSRLLALRGGESSAAAAVQAAPASASAGVGEGAQSAAAPAISLDALKARIAAVLLWENVLVSGAAFALGNALFALVLLAKWSPLSLASRLLFLAIMAGFLYTTFSKFLVGFLGPDIVKKPTLGGDYISAASLAPLVEPAVAALNAALDSVARACWCVSYAHTAKYLGASWALSKLGTHLSSGGALYAAFLAAFAAPPLRRQYRAEIDETLAAATARAEALKAQVRSVVSERAAVAKERVLSVKADVKQLWASTLSSVKAVPAMLGGQLGGVVASGARAAGGVAARGAGGADEADDEEDDDPDLASEDEDDEDDEDDE